MNSPKRILVIMLRRIGDVLLTTPALHALRKRYPDATIDFLTEPPCNEVLAGNPDVSEVLVFRKEWRWWLEVRRRKYDLVVDLMGNPRGAILSFVSGAPFRAGPGFVFHRWAYNHRMEESPKTCYAPLEKMRMMRSVGIELDESDILPRLSVSETAEAWAKEALQDSEGPLVGLVPASRKETRRWPAESFAALGRTLAEHEQARVLVFWGPGEESLARQVAALIGNAAIMSPQTKGLHELAALIGRCKLVVTNCNGPKHIAVARGVPTLTIHASSDPDAWNPPNDPRFQFIRNEELPCIACRLNECPYQLECVRELSPDAVAAKAIELLRARAVAA